MHIVTKILIVFCAVLSLLLAALTMAFAANANALRTNLAHEQNMAQAAKAEASGAAANYGIMQNNLDKQIQSLRDDNASKDKSISGLQAERTDLRSRIQQAQADADRGQGQIAQFQATVQTQTALIKNYRDEVTALREQMLTASKHEIELLDKLSDMTSSREVLEQNARALKEQLEELKLTNQTLQQQAASGGTVTNMSASLTPHELPGPLVRARVTKVFKSPAGDDMVVINEGSNRGLKEGILMNIARADGFVASVVLTTVQPTEAVGRISLAKSQVQSDDIVLSRLEP